MESFLSFLLVALLTMFFVRRYMKKLDAPKAAAAPARAEEARRPCPRCEKPIPSSSTFCSHCGAPLAMWQVHRAAVQEAGSQAGSGKPKPVINASLCIGCGSCVDVCPETGALELVRGKAILANPTACTGHAKCADACPTSAITLAFDGVLQTSRVPRVKENFETNIDGLYIVGELGGMGLIKTAINEGKLVIDHLRQRIEADARVADNPDTHDASDVLIVGSGPAGLSAALSAHQFGLNYTVLEAGEIASTIRQYPRHKFLMSEPVSMPLYGNLYVADGTKESLLTVWETIVSNTGVRIRTNERVTSVRKNGSGFVIGTPAKEYRARYVVLALGKRGTPRRLGIPGEDLPKVSYRLIEAETYEGKNILVVGGGDSAIEAALAVSRDGRNRVTLSYRGENFQRARERNRARLEEAEQKGIVEVMRNSQVAQICPDSVRMSRPSGESDMPNDFVFVLIGGESPEEFLRKTGVEIVEKAVANLDFNTQ